MMTLRPAINFMKKLHQSLTPNYSAVATNAAKKKLVSIMGQEGFASFMNANGGFNVKNMAKVIPAELARIEAGGAPAAASTTTAAAPRQLIRLGSTGAPTKPVAPSPTPKPSKTSEFVPAKPTAKPRAAGECPAGAFGVDEAERRTREVFGSIPAMSATANESSRWMSLENCYRVNGFAAPWADNANKVDTQIAKLNGGLFAKRARVIASLFQS